MGLFPMNVGGGGTASSLEYSEYILIGDDTTTKQSTNSYSAGDVLLLYGDCGGYTLGGENVITFTNATEIDRFPSSNQYVLLVEIKITNAGKFSINSSRTGAGTAWKVEVVKMS